MINNLIDLIRFIVISAEAVVALVITAIFYYSPQIFQPIGLLIISDDKKIVFALLGLPVAGLIYGYRFANDLTAPKGMDENMRKKFFNWNGYPKLGNRVYFALILCFISLIVNICFWVLSKKLEVGLIGFVFSLTNGVWFVSILSLATANLTLKAILGGRRQ